MWKYHIVTLKTIRSQRREDQGHTNVEDAKLQWFIDRKKKKETTSLMKQKTNFGNNKQNLLPCLV